MAERVNQALISYQHIADLNTSSLYDLKSDPNINPAKVMPGSDMRNATGDDFTQCGICLSQVKPADPYTLMSCGHSMHSECLARLAVHSEHLRCPSCRKSLDCITEEPQIRLGFYGALSRYHALDSKWLSNRVATEQEIRLLDPGLPSSDASEVSHAMTFNTHQETISDLAFAVELGPNESENWFNLAVAMASSFGICESAPTERVLLYVNEKVKFYSVLEVCEFAKSISASEDAAEMVQNLIESVEQSLQVHTQEPIEFYRVGESFGVFSNFAALSVEVDGRQWPTTEHYYQAMKFSDYETQEMIRSNPSPMDAAQVGRDPARQHSVRANWDGIKDDVMWRALEAKFSQHPAALQLLSSTAPAPLVEHTKNDSYWADAGDGSGLNRLGTMLEQLRSDFSLYSDVLPEQHPQLAKLPLSTVFAKEYLKSNTAQLKMARLVKKDYLKKQIYALVSEHKNLFEFTPPKARPYIGRFCSTLRSTPPKAFEQMTEDQLLDELEARLFKFHADNGVKPTSPDFFELDTPVYSLSQNALSEALLKNIRRSL